MLRVLIADDSAVTREYFRLALAADPALSIVGVAADGAQAVVLAEELRPDVIVMDVIMPTMDGYEATRRIMERVPTPIVLVSASLDPAEVEVTFRAIRAGALTILEKPHGPASPDHASEMQRMIETIKLMAEVRVIRRWPRRPPRGKPSVELSARSPGIRIVAIGGSTGGPQAIAEILSHLPSSMPVPIVMVQHMTPGFSAGFAASLDRDARLTVKLAEADEMARPGFAYLAPDRMQLGITHVGRFQLVKPPTTNGFCPSVSFLFESVAGPLAPRRWASC
jgi:two-component system chemotaxis response regulator CheB